MSVSIRPVRIAAFLLAGLMLWGCRRAPDAPGAVLSAENGATPLPFPTLVDIPTLLPTASPFPTPSTTATRPPSPTAAPETPIAFDQVVVDLTYSIPDLALERRLEGNLASQIRLVDETTGREIERANQAGLLLELQGALTDLDLPPLPDDCPRCVRLSYELPVSNLAASGWLTDTRLLASIENFTAVQLGPHFPPDTILGLRRSANATHPAHTVALTGDGRLWIWTATDPVVPEPAALADDGLLDALAAVPLDGLTDRYTAECDGAAVETLYLQQDGAETTPAETAVLLICPELALPITLLPVYTRLDALAAAALGDGWQDAPTRPVPLAALLDYQRADGARLTVEMDGRATAVAPGGAVVTGTLPAAQIVSDTVAALRSGLLEPIVDYPTAVDGSVLAARGPAGWAAARWLDVPPAPLADVVDGLDGLLDRWLEPAAAPAATGTPGEGG